ncbi:MAG: hypothetical protein KDD35_05535 [Bdellovibrionales bacterium]|nr:hypothetical protein [Bdellovibrionales bacterium]
MISRNVFISLFFGITISNAAFSQSVRQYLAEEIETLASCEDTARQASNSLRALNASVLNTQCAEVRHGYTLKIIYSSSSTIPIQKTYDPLRVSLLSQGIYDSKEDCLGDLDNRVEMFSEQTGIAPHLTDCFKTLNGGNLPYAARIEGFGFSETSHFLTGTTIYAANGLDLSTLAHKVETNLSNYDFIHVDRVAWKSRPGRQYELIVFYYGRGDYAVWDYNIATLPTQDDCLLAKDEFFRDFSDVSGYALTPTCLPQSFGTSYKLSVIYFTTLSPSSFESEVSFASLTDCRDQKSSIFDIEQNATRKHLFSPICTQANDGSFKIKIHYFDL